MIPPFLQLGDAEITLIEGELGFISLLIAGVFGYLLRMSAKLSKIEQFLKDKFKANF